MPSKANEASVPVTKLQHALDYLHSRYGGIEAAMIIAQKKKELESASVAREPERPASIGRSQGGEYWCAEHGDLKVPCEHWARVTEWLRPSVEPAAQSQPTYCPMCSSDSKEVKNIVIAAKDGRYTCPCWSGWHDEVSPDTSPVGGEMAGTRSRSDVLEHSHSASPAKVVYAVMNSGFWAGEFATKEWAEQFAAEKFPNSPEVEISGRIVERGGSDGR